MEKLGVVPRGNEDDGHVVLWDDLSQKEKQRCGLVRAVAGQKRQAAKNTAGRRYCARGDNSGRRRRYLGCLGSVDCVCLIR